MTQHTSTQATSSPSDPTKTNQTVGHALFGENHNHDGSSMECSMLTECVAAHYEPGAEWPKFLAFHLDVVSGGFSPRLVGVRELASVFAGPGEAERAWRSSPWAGDCWEVEAY